MTKLTHCPAITIVIVANVYIWGGLIRKSHCTRAININARPTDCVIHAHVIFFNKRTLENITEMHPVILFLQNYKLGLV